MRLCAPDTVVQRLLPIYNADAEDRSRAWNEWLSQGGSEPVRKFIRWTNGTSTEDDEILQETLIIAYLKVERGLYEDRSLPFTAFLKKIAWYKIMEASRRNAGQVSLDDLYEYASEEHHEHERAEFWKEQEALQRGLDELPPRRSRIMLLYEYGYTTAEIAKLLNIREELVRKEKSLGLRQLRETVTMALAG